MRAGVDHIIVNVNDYAAAKKFYAWLMPQIGYPKAMSYDQPQTDVTAGYFGDHGSLWIRPSTPSSAPTSSIGIASDYARSRLPPRAAGRSTI